jgi:hypothetical protein
VGDLGDVRAPQRRWARAAALACLAGLAVTGCASDGGNPTTNAERVTVTESVTPTATATTPTSDVQGRHYDVGTVSGVSKVGGELVLKLDRWTVKGLSDAKLAKDGITITPHTGNRFTNQNDDRLRNVPVAPGATVVVNTCVKNGDQLGLTSTPQDAVSWLDDVDPKTVLLLTYDSAGRVVRMDTDPRC